MKLLRPGSFALALVIVAAGCGSSDRSGQASQTVQSYWYDIGHMKLDQAYALMTPGNQADRPKNNYEQDMMGFLQNTGGISVKTGKPIVSGDMATVPVRMFSPKASKPLSACQHLIWTDGKWLISDQNGALSPPNLCSGKA